MNHPRWALVSRTETRCPQPAHFYMSPRRQVRLRGHPLGGVLSGERIDPTDEA